MTKKRHDTRLADRLIQEREQRQWTLHQAAMELGVGWVSLYRWEKGDTWPHADALAKIHRVYGFTLADLERAPARIWMVPFHRNQYFTGREHVLKSLRKALTQQNAVAVISQQRRTNDARSRALSGFGGMGKTQTAVEYAYRHSRAYEIVLWAVGDSRKALFAAFTEFARRLELSEQGDGTDEERLAQRVKEHLESRETRTWLLIVDNADNLALLKTFLPTRSLRNNGATLVTTRQRAVGKQMTRIDLETLTQEEGVSFLLRRLGAARDAAPDALPASERQAAVTLYALMDGLPLALDQAAAYIEETDCSLVDYLALYRERRGELLTRSSAVDAEEHPQSVGTTLLLSLLRIESEFPAAAELLRLCAYLAPDAIPVEIFAAGADAFGPTLAPVAANPKELRRAIAALSAYSLVKWHASAKMLAIHRLVQAVLQETQARDEQRLWAQRALLAVNAAFPDFSLLVRTQIERVSAQAFHVTQAVTRYELYCVEAGRLLCQVGQYFQTVGRDEHRGASKSLYHQALSILKEKAGSRDARLVEPLMLLSTSYLDLGQYAEAERHARLAWRIGEHTLGAEHPHVAFALTNLGCCYEEQGKFALAEEVYQRALAIYRLRYGATHDQVGVALFNVACVHRERGRYTDAESLFQQALDMWNQLLGANSLYAAFALDGLGSLRREQQRYDEAEAFLLDSLAIWKTVNELHPGAGYPLLNVSRVYHAQGKYTDAETFYRRALAVRELQAVDHPLVAAPLAGLAHLACDQRRYEQAEMLLQRAQRICAQGDDSHPAHIETLLSAARLREEQGRYAEAHTCCARALAGQKRSLGAQHPRTIATRQWLARIQQRLEWTDEPEVFFA